jgi:ABC-2 type transport system ATP-binding protein
LKLTGVVKKFGSTTAVDGLSLTIKRGEVFGLLGPNGAGKTTSISMTIGLIKPDAGTVELCGIGSPDVADVRRHIGVAPQALALYSNLTADENLRFFGQLYGLSGAKLRDRVSAVLNDVGLESRRNDRVRGFSGGMMRRLNLAVAMLHEPAILLLDEPTAGVDPQSRNNIIDMVLRLRDAGTTIVYTTHYMEEAQKLCDRIGVIDRGKLLALGTLAEIMSVHATTSTVTLVRDGGEEHVSTSDPLKELSRVLSDPSRAAGLTGVKIERASLESVFLNLTGRSLRD